MNTEKVVVIGAGPSGLAAAHQLKLYGLNPLVFECDKPGGLLRSANSVVNYPGVPSGISGRELVKLFPLPERIVFSRVSHLERDSSMYRIKSDTGTVEALSVVVASGTVPKKITIPGVDENRIHYGIETVHQAEGTGVAVVGGGDAALDYALSLSELYSVTVYSRGTFSRVVPHLLAKVKQVKNITLLPASFPETVINEETVVAAVGRTAGVDFISQNLLSSPPADGSFHLCGDCTNGIYRQTAIAVGNGIEAAMKTAAFLKKAETAK